MGEPTKSVEDEIKIDSLSPYFLGSHDGPGILITPVKLRGENYDEWSRSVRMSLKSRRKFGFCDGTITKPTSQAMFEHWECVNCTVVQWIMNTIDPSLKTGISYYEEAQPLWEDLKERFSVVDGLKLQNLKSSIASCKQTKGMSVTTYYGNLKALWDALANHEPLFACKCGGCKCDIAKQSLGRQDGERLHQFFMGLDDKLYGAIRSQQLALNPLPSLNRAYQTVIQEERLKGMATAKDEVAEVMTFAVKPESRPKGRTVDAREKERLDKSKLYCSHCRRNGHDDTTCFEIHGYPEWWEDRPRGKIGGTNKVNNGGIGAGNTNTGAGRGRNGNGVVRANVVTTNNIDATSTSVNRNGGDDVSGLSGLNPDQLQKLMSMLEESNASSERLNGTYLDWIVDSGATNHVTGDITSFRNTIDIPDCPVRLPNGQKVIATKEGVVKLDDVMILRNVLFVPKLNCNLISVSQLVRESNCILQFTHSMCVIQDRDSRMVIGAGEQRDGLYLFRKAPVVMAMQVQRTGSMDLWHQRLGHASEKIVKLIPLVSSSSKASNKACDVCHYAKQSRDPFPVSLNRSKEIFELIHCDLWGAYRSPSSCGAHYFLTIVDDFSRSVWVYLLIDKTEVTAMFMHFLAMVERQFGKQVKKVQSDNGTEFNFMSDYFFKNGIVFQTSCVGTPQQNGRVERKHQHILNVARALLFQGHLSTDFWGECVLTAAYLINRTPSVLLHNKSPYEVLFGQPPAYDMLRVFGCLCFAHNKKHKGDKFASRSRKCIFVGYPHGKKGWKLYDMETGEYFVSRDVKFYETEFPFGSNSNTSEIIDDSPDIFRDDNDELVDATVNVTDEPSVVCSDGEVVNIPSPEILIGDPSTPATNLEQNTETVDEVPPYNGVIESVELGKGKRIKYQSTRLKDHVTHTVQKDSPSRLYSSPAYSPSSGTPYPITHFVNCNNFSIRHRNFLAAVNAGVEPTSFKEAMNDPGWRNAMQDEIRALEDNKTWVMTNLPPGKKALGCRWVYKIKFKSDGSIERLKARLVVFGNHQVEGLDYNETFAPVAKMVTVRAFLAIAAAKNWELHQMDVHNAFLHGDLDEEVYMKLPPGFGGGKDGLVCRLEKSLYGLKQAPRCWFAKLAMSLKHYGFLQSQSDYSLFTLYQGPIQLNILIYVDDLVISGNDANAIQKFKSYLGKCFHMKDLGPLKYFLGIEVARSADGIFLNQRKYALDVIADVGLLGAKPVAFPVEQNHKLALAKGPLIKDVEQYRRLIGRLVYLAVTRPDLSYAVHILSQFLQNPRQEHWDAALRVVRYLKGCPGQGILLRADSDLSVSGWCDSDWASCPLTRRSLTGWFVSLGHSPISWKTKKQHTVSRSSAEAEYRSMAAITCELKWLKGLLLSLGVEHPRAIPLYCDSQSALYIAQNPVFHERTKHIEVDCHFVRDAVQEGIIEPFHVSTKEQLADLFTKALGRQQFDYLLHKLGILDLHAPT